MPICPECGAMVSNLRKHLRRNRCEKHKGWAECGRINQKHKYKRKEE